MVGGTPRFLEDCSPPITDVLPSKSHSYLEVGCLPLISSLVLTIGSCLFHVFKILLYRPMLCHRSNNQRPDASHLVECVSSATTIIAIFDLYCRTFGVDYCILSLSYSVYTAASIFLLQIQAATSRDDEALERLKFCIIALEKVKISNPGNSPYYVALI